MNAEEFLSHEELEQHLRSMGLQFLPGPEEGTWALPFSDPSEGTTTLVLLASGRGNPRFISAQVALMQATQNRDCFHKALSLANGAMAIAKATIDGSGTAGVHTTLFRSRQLFHPEMLRHAVQSVVSAAGFIRPILKNCLDGRGDLEGVFNRRLSEVAPGGTRLVPPG